MKKRILKIIHIILLLLIALLYTASIFSKMSFPKETLEEYYFYGVNGIGSSDTSILFYGLKHYTLLFILNSFILLMLFYSKFKIFNIFKKYKKLYTTVIVILLSIFSLYNINAYIFIYNNIVKTTIYEDEYIEGKKENISFESKKNLIMIYVESLETTFMDKENGGAWNYNIIPELTKLLNDEDATYFTSNENNRGELSLYGTTWTTASIISNSSGLPFKMPLSTNKYTNTNFLNSVYTIGDLLKDNGYKNEVISGAKTSFGGLIPYFNNHGSYEIIDPDTLVKYGYEINDDTKGSWGFNDKYMFEIAKERILKHVENNELFNETLIGIDTHPMDGYKTNYTISKYNSNYENVYATDSKLIYDFVTWIKSQDFYKDTVIVITGDHLCMQEDFFKGISDTSRGRYNVIINSSIKTDNNKNRKFTSIDMYPTIVASLGGKIKNDQIGLGVNLFSNKKTLSEKYGFEKFNKEVSKKSKLYSKMISGE